MIATKDKLTKEQFDITSERMWLFALYMYTMGSESFGNGRESAKRARYKGTNNALDQRQHELVSNSKVRAVKAAICDEIKEELDWNRATNLAAQHKQIARYELILDKHPDNLQALQGLNAVLRELNASNGQHSHSIKLPSTEREELSPLQRRAGMASAAEYKRVMASESDVGPRTGQEAGNGH